ncbi:hypothetical protein [Corynebacterium accolens]|uniref:hypothetical protein n=1 Tax=Corynebacterium accolens TaxID=38284 RepID=UPI00254DC120|nr:hypothetical protein [Corynebacterium accolens]MDK8469847.1 hypothetical protein [Corynebacterium accolens]
MTKKETAVATVEAFFKLLGRKVQVDDAWERNSFMGATVHDYQGRYTISTESFKDSPDTITVRVYNFADKTKNFFILDVSRVSPELAARFTQEAIDAYEQKLGAKA